MSDQLKTVPPEISRKLADVTVKALGDDKQVALIADMNHYKTPETIGVVTQKAFWEEIKKTGKKPVFATELFSMEQQVVIDALSSGTISKAGFVGYMAAGDPSDQMTKAEQRKFMTDVADLVQSGVRVVGLNNSHGMGGEFAKKAGELGAQIALDGLSEWERNEADFYKDPAAVLTKMMDEGYARVDQMQGNQRSDFLEQSSKVSEKINKGEPITTDDFATISEVKHPKYNEFRLNSNASLDPKQNTRDMDKRAEKDDEVVRIIQRETSDPDAVVIVSYGGGHIGGFYKQLEHAGTQPADPIVPYLGADHFKCMKPEAVDCMKIEHREGEMRELLDKSLKGVPQIKIPDMYGM